MEAGDEELNMHKRALDIARRLAPLSAGGLKRFSPSLFKRPSSGNVPSAKRPSFRGRRLFVAPALGSPAPPPLTKPF